MKIIAISKTFPLEHIMPLIELGHDHFGENKVQEALSKWRDIKKIKPDLKLHMVGKLQSNKAKDAVKLFDYIHSLDNDNVKVPWEINQLTKFIHYIITKQLQLDSHNGMFCS